MYIYQDYGDARLEGLFLSLSLYLCSPGEMHIIEDELVFLFSSFFSVFPSFTFMFECKFLMKSEENEETFKKG